MTQQVIMLYHIALPGAPDVRSAVCRTPWPGPHSASSLLLPLTETSSVLEMTQLHINTPQFLYQISWSQEKITPAQV